MPGYEIYPNPDNTPNETTSIGVLVFLVSVPFWICIIIGLIALFCRG